MNNPEFSDAMESFLDSHDLQETLLTLSNICWEKAAHIERNWQDSKTAAEWSKAAEAIERASEAKAVRTVSAK
jgi:hypothetical protein